MPLTAAIYARKSTDQGGVSDDDRSVARQVDHARAYATRKGWRVEESAIFVDDGISGAEFSNRPGFVRLMSALKPRPAFDVLVMSEESRLGREAIETAYALKQLITAGVRVFFYLEDRERTLDGPMDKMMLSLTAFADELEREKARQRTYDALSRKASAGHVTGGRVFGYDNEEILGAPDAAGRRVRQRVERRINETEAAVVRRIFTLCAEGAGKSRIAKQLNAEGARAPRAQRGRPTAWAPSSVHEVLYRPLYRGEIVWNKTQKRNQWGRVAPVARPEAAWLRQEAEHLRIIPEALWEAAHARLSAAREKYLRGTDGKLWGRPRDLESKYLLSGLARCGCCGGGLIVRSRHHGRHRAFFYACGSYHQRGATVCTNSTQIPIGPVDAEVLDRLRGLLSPDILAEAVSRAVETLQAPAPDQSRGAREELAAIEAELANLAGAVAAGAPVASLVEALRTRQARAEALRKEIRRTQAPTIALPSPDALRASLEARAEEWRILLAGQVAQARQILRKVLTGPVVCTPATRDAAAGWAISGAAALDRVISGGKGLPRFLASPTGFEPVF